MRDVAQRPQAAVGEPVVVPGFLFLGEPDAPDAVGRAFGRHHHVVGRIRRFPVRVAAAVRDPRPRARAHHRLERGHQAARGPLHLDALVAPHVNVRLPVGDDEDFLALQIVAQDCPEHVGRPVDLAFVARLSLRLELPDERLEIARHGPQFAQGHFGLAAAEGFAPDHRLQTRDPAAPADLRDHHGDQRDDRRDRRKEIEDVLLRVLAAPLNEAHVVHQHQIAVRGALGLDAVDRHVDRAALEIDQAALADHGLGAVFSAADRGGKRRRLVDHPAAQVAETDREQPLVGDDPVEKPQDLGARTLAHEILKRLLDRVGDERGADVQVAHEPLERESVDERYDRVRDGCECDGEGKDEAKRQSHASSCRFSCSPAMRKAGTPAQCSTFRHVRRVDTARPVDTPGLPRRGDVSSTGGAPGDPLREKRSRAAKRFWPGATIAASIGRNVADCVQSCCGRYRADCVGPRLRSGWARGARRPGRFRPVRHHAPRRGAVSPSHSQGGADRPGGHQPVQARLHRIQDWSRHSRPARASRA